jgi:hypothetical protein
MSNTAMHGGEEIVVKYRDGRSEPIIVRSLPPKLLQRWASLQGDEASLVELYCGKLNTAALYKHRNLAERERKLFSLLQEATDLETIDKLQGQLESVQSQILELEETERWDDTLTPESHDEIYAIGERLNRPRYERWVENTRESTARFRETTERMAKMNGSPAADSTSSSRSLPSAPVDAERN